MHLKIEQRLLLLKFIVSYAVLFLLFKLPVTVFADKGEPVNPVHPNEILGLADACCGEVFLTRNITGCSRSPCCGEVFLT